MSSLLEIQNRGLSVPGTLAAALGVKLLELTDEKAVAALSPHGGGRQVGTNLWLGEAIEALAGLTAGALTAVRDDEDPNTVLVTHGATSRSTHLLRTSSAETVGAVATWVRKGRRQAVIEVSVTDSEGRELLRMLSEHSAYPEPFRISPP